jgi:uncharacterized protein (TIGR02001 family)
LDVGLLWGSAHADTTSTWTAGSDSDFRGNSQTATDPALQVTFDYGVYAGIFGSNVDFGPALDANHGIDACAGVTSTLNETFGWETGTIYYAYAQESDINYLEIYCGLSCQWVKTKLWNSNQFNGDLAEVSPAAARATMMLPRSTSKVLRLILHLQPVDHRRRRRRKPEAQPDESEQHDAQCHLPWRFPKVVAGVQRPSLAGSWIV